MAQVVKNLSQETQFDPWIRTIPLEKGMAPHSSSFLEFHEQRSLTGYSAWGHKESDVTGQLHFSHVGTRIETVVLERGTQINGIE